MKRAGKRKPWTSAEKEQASWLQPGEKRKAWTQTGDLLGTFKYRAGIQSDKISILNSVWARELGHYSRYWTLVAVRNGVLFVKPRSSSAAQELQMRAPQIIRGLNKYFTRAWIRGVKALSR